jgi:hypothetical protein
MLTVVVIAAQMVLWSKAAFEIRRAGNPAKPNLQAMQSHHYTKVPR